MATVLEMLERARRGLQRVTPEQAQAAAAAGAVMVDIRSDSQRAADGEIPGAVFISRNVLEWRCDPTSEWRDARVCDPARQLILVCQDGDQSSLAAANLQELGHARATDVIGGFRAWRAAGLPVSPPAPGA